MGIEHKEYEIILSFQGNTFRVRGLSYNQISANNGVDMKIKEHNQIKAMAIMIERKNDIEFLTQLAICFPKVVLKAADDHLSIKQTTDIQIKDLYKEDRRIPAIKLARVTYNMGLKDAKDYCDRLCNYQPNYF